MRIKTLGFLISIMLIGTITTFAQSAKREYLDVGDSVKIYPRVDWIKGSPLEKLDPSKIYIIDLWATWCKPCIAAMPHLNALAEKFKESNIVFIAQDVMEDDKQKVIDFVKNNEKMMGFNIATGGGKGSEFERDWIKPAGVSAIPQTFVIKNNVLLWQTSPDTINEPVLNMLIDGTFSIEKAKQVQAKN